MAKIKWSKDSIDDLKEYVDLLQKTRRTKKNGGSRKMEGEKWRVKPS